MQKTIEEYVMDEDENSWSWTDEMIEGLVEEETPKFKVNDLKYPKTYEECIGKFPSVTFENSPQQVDIKLIKEN